MVGLAQRKDGLNVSETLINHMRENSRYLYLFKKNKVNRINNITIKTILE